MSETLKQISLFILDSNDSPALFITHYTKWVVDLPSFPRFVWVFIIDSPKGEDLILGYVFLYHLNPIIDWKSGLITYDSSNKDYSGINPSTSNDLATSFNSFALEKWDREEEPEEIETVLKVVPPAYHQYLDVFSKGKAEKVPPDRTCDHHIKPEGLLPTVGVIYASSNQDSEELWAYI
ncbi:hypothetical protein O181_070238 [Austropuccinia psidii MF-1]|uniref:Uncharacterized protein n=1 Tax=Austropuccinia psidii MF-1 TaxID=1389203 RepID=A0A9Q3EYQ5_9BASI|nr:hypothetical protein [Austropuccinia psidii MF-1]